MKKKICKMLHNSGSPAFSGRRNMLTMSLSFTCTCFSSVIGSGTYDTLKSKADRVEQTEIRFRFRHC